MDIHVLSIRSLIDIDGSSHPAFVVIHVLAVISNPVPELVIVSGQGDMLDHAPQRMRRPARMMRVDHSRQGTLSEKMIVAISLVRDQSKVTSAWMQHARYVVQVLYQVRLMLDTIAAHGEIEFRFDDAQITGRRQPMDEGGIRILDPLRNRAPYEILSRQDIEIFDVVSDHERAEVRADLQHARRAGYKSDEIPPVLDTVARSTLVNSV